MSRVLKVFCSPAEQENLAGSYLVIERYEGFVLIDVADDTVAAIARRFLVEDITDQYTIRMENEHVVNPTPGAWTVQVIASNIPQGPQDFAMVVLRHFGQPLPEANPIEVEVSPKLGIPDNSPQGVSSTLHVGQSDSIAGVRVSADITHTCIGDLRVMLAAPDNQRITRHSRSGRQRGQHHRDLGHGKNPRARQLGRHIHGRQVEPGRGRSGGAGCRQARSMGTADNAGIGRSNVEAPIFAVRAKTSL